ncbi:MAG: DUF2500 domain-containing protein [Eubacteriales bacterium]
MVFDPYASTGIMFTIVPVIVAIGFIVVIGMIIYRTVQGAQQWKRNNDSPVLTVDAKVVTKRTDVSHHHHANTTNNTMDMGYSTTYYYVTFEVESGDRMEFHVSGDEFGLLAEGDTGKITFQGTRYLGFTRGA